MCSGVWQSASTTTQTCSAQRLARHKQRDTPTKIVVLILWIVVVQVECALVTVSVPIHIERVTGVEVLIVGKTMSKDSPQYHVLKHEDTLNYQKILILGS